MAKGNEPTASPIQITSRNAVHVPIPHDFLSVSLVEWERCMENVKNMPETGPGSDSAGWALIGAGVGGMFSALSLAASVEFSKIVDSVEVVNWRGVIFTFLQLLVAALGLACGRIFLLRANDQRVNQRHYKERFHVEMDGIRRRCIPHELNEDSVADGTPRLTLR